MTLFFQWVDGVWILVALLLAKKNQRLVSIAFIVSCMLMMRMQVEMLASAGFAHGIFKLLPYTIFERGLACYSLLYTVYCAFLKFSPGSRGSILLATVISLFFIGFFVSSFVMLL